MIITFFFLVLYTALQPYCTSGLSKTQACALIAQFISLYSGICLIIDSYIRKDQTDAGVSDTTSQFSSVLEILILGSNLVMLVWPGVMFLLSGEFAEKYEILTAKVKSLLQPSEPASKPIDNQDDGGTHNEARQGILVVLNEKESGHHGDDTDQHMVTESQVVRGQNMSRLEDEPGLSLKADPKAHDLSYQDEGGGVFQV